MTTIYHLTRKIKSKRYTIATLNQGDCPAHAERVFRMLGYDIKECDVNFETVKNMKIYGGRLPECQDHVITERQAEDFYILSFVDDYTFICGTRRDAWIKVLENWQDIDSQSELDHIRALRDADTTPRTQPRETEPAKQPTEAAQFPMVQGEGAPQYTFALDTATEPTQLALL